MELHSISASSFGSPGWTKALAKTFSSRGSKQNASTALLKKACLNWPISCWTTSEQHGERIRPAGFQKGSLAAWQSGKSMVETQGGDLGWRSVHEGKSPLKAAEGHFQRNANRQPLRDLQTPVHSRKNPRQATVSRR